MLHNILVSGDFKTCLGDSETKPGFITRCILPNSPLLSTTLAGREKRLIVFASTSFSLHLPVAAHILGIATVFVQVAFASTLPSSVVYSTLWNNVAPVCDSIDDNSLFRLPRLSSPST
jgi:hypothetical protein